MHLISDENEHREAATAQLLVEHSKRLTYASLQNAVPLLRKIELQAGEEGLPAGRLRLDVYPPFAQSREWPFDRISAGGSVVPVDLETKQDSAFFDSLNEAEHGQLRLVAEFDDDHPSVSFEAPIELLARDEWGGIHEMGQLLAAFVQPNDVRVAAILRAASNAMTRQGLPAGLDGYQSQDPARVWAIAAAIWSSIEGMDLRYAVPPASFERRGQKVRMPGRLAEEGLGTCLDTSLLLAAALEAAGLNPVVIFTEGHAFAGVWLVSRTFSTAETWDVTELRKAIVASEFIPFETTLLTGGKRGTFRSAVAEGSAQLDEAKEHLFGVAVDIARCRSSGVRPLARASEPTETDAPAAADPMAASEDLLPPEGFEPPDLAQEKALATPQGRIDRWQRRPDHNQADALCTHVATFGCAIPPSRPSQLRYCPLR